MPDTCLFPPDTVARLRMLFEKSRGSETISPADDPLDYPHGPAAAACRAAAEACGDRVPVERNAPA